MGSRKARPKKAPPAADAAAVTDEHELRPSATMTREVEAVTAEKLIARSMTAGSDPKVSAAPPAAPTEPRAFDELAQTVEAPSTPRILVLDAAEVLIADAGFAAVTEAEIAGAAGVTLDVLRAHFADKAALLRALHDRFCAQATSVTDDSTRSGIWDHASPRDVVEVAVRSILDVVLGRAELVRAVIASGDPELLDGFRRVGANITAKVSRVIEELRDEDKPGERDVAFVLLLAVSLAHHAIMLGTEWSGVAFEREELYDRATRATRAYLDARRRPS
ncbi:MAG: TetR/AcrR family transcriptional regulator [Labilithrix sp.]|nr:TetR/AcrR family transcriptional regulator [Labilithrix sp.]